MTKERDLPKEQPQNVAFRRNMKKLKLDLSNIKQRMNGNWGSPGYGIEEEVHPQFDGGNYLVFKNTAEDDDAQSLLRCHLCDFEINISLVCTHLDDVHCYVPKNMLCPVCDGKLGEDDIKVAQNLSPQKRTYKTEKCSVSSGDSVVLDKKVRTRGSKHDAVFDPLLSPFICDSVDIHAREDSSNYASDISNAKGFGTDASLDMGDEQDIAERRMKD